LSNAGALTPGEFIQETRLHTYLGWRFTLEEEMDHDPWSRMLYTGAVFLQLVALAYEQV